MSVTITITLTYEGTIVGNLYNKTNAPYLIAGTLATLALLASGTLAVAPYVAFLSSIAAFNVALPVALISTLILVLSCKMISRNKKLAAQGAELNEKTELAAEQENTIQSLEPQIKGLNKKVSDLETKLDEISKQTNGAATKDEVKQLRGELGSLTEKYNQIANLGEKLDSAATKGAVEKLRGEFAEELKKLNDEVVKLIDSAATKDEVEELSKKFSSFTTKLDEISKQANGAATKDEVEELKAKIASAATKDEVEELSKKFSSFTTKLDEIVKQIGSAATKDEVEELVTKIASAATKEELKAGLNGAATKEELKAGLNGTATKEELEERFGNFIKEDEVKEELQMNFYGKDEEREKMTLDNVMLPNNIKQKLVRIYQPNALEKREGYILHGPPGTGKTMIARAIASETKGISAFISVSASSLFNIQNIDDLFKKAKENAPCIVFIDEIEGFGKMRNLHGNNVEYLDHFLTKIGGFDSIKDVTVVAATNRISDLDGALTRCMVPECDGVDLV
ncbi:AAA family ATPase [Wolbachia endosymbiont of Nasonia oneida]|nr:AAA family ATPase [Wolbachia endosymbiont of Nasonia oneida]